MTGLAKWFLKPTFMVVISSVEMYSKNGLKVTIQAVTLGRIHGAQVEHISV